MKNFTKVALATLFVTNFTLFLGWVPIGVLIPQVLFFLLAIAMQPKVFGSRTLVLYYLFFAYQFISGLVSGNGYDITVLGARFLGMAIPLLISTVLFSPKYIRDCHGVSKYALIVSFITVALSIRVLINDGSALRVTSMANSMGDWEVLYKYWRQGMAGYDMAAMMMLMPVVLIFRLKSNVKGNEKWLLWIGIITILVFMYLGQVTTTFIICIMVTLVSFLNVKNRASTIVGIGLIVLLLITQFTSLMEFAISSTGDTEMNEKFVVMAGAAEGEVLDESSDAGVRWMLLSKTINSFISHPLFGSSTSPIGGHNYFLDILAKYGIIGCLPFFLLIHNQYKIIISYLSETAKRYYLIIIIGFISLGIIKNMSGTEYWNYLFIYYPAILVWIDGISNKRRRIIKIKEYKKYKPHWRFRNMSISHYKKAPVNNYFQSTIGQ